MKQICKGWMLWKMLSDGLHTMTKCALSVLHKGSLKSGFAGRITYKCPVLPHEFCFRQKKRSIFFQDFQMVGTTVRTRLLDTEKVLMNGCSVCTDLLMICYASSSLGCIGLQGLHTYLSIWDLCCIYWRASPSKSQYTQSPGCDCWYVQWRLQTDFRALC